MLRDEGPPGRAGGRRPGGPEPPPFPRTVMPVLWKPPTRDYPGPAVSACSRSVQSTRCEISRFSATLAIRVSIVAPRWRFGLVWLPLAGASGWYGWPSTSACSSLLGRLGGLLEIGRGDNAFVLLVDGNASGVELHADLVLVGQFGWHPPRVPAGEASAILEHAFSDGCSFRIEDRQLGFFRGAAADIQAIAGFAGLAHQREA